MLFLLVASSILMVSVGENIEDTDDVIKWNAKVSSSEHYNITQCFNEKPFYKYRTGNNVTVDMLIESDVEVNSLRECLFGSQFFRPVWSVHRINSTHQHLKILSVIKTMDRFDLDDLRCFVKLGKGNNYMDLQCLVRIFNMDSTATFTMFTLSSGYVAAKISVDLNKTSIIQEVEVLENTTLSVDCVPLGDGYKHATTIKKKYGDLQIVSRRNEAYFFKMRKSSDITEYRCSETKGNDKHEAALRLKLLDTEYSKNENIEELEPISNLGVHAEVSADPVKPYLMRDVVFHNNSKVTVNCNYGETDYVRTMNIKDQSVQVNNDTHQISLIFNFLKNLNEQFNGSVISCIETKKQTNLTHEKALKFVYHDNFTSLSNKKNQYVNVTNYVTFRIKTSFGDVLSTTECFNEQPTYRVPRESLMIVTVIPDTEMTAGWCKINDLKFISESFTRRNEKMEGDYYLSMRIPMYVSGDLICEMQYQGRAIGLCRTYIEITDGKTLPNNTDNRSNSSLIQAIVSMDNLSTAAELVFRDDNSLVVDCQFGGVEYEHALIFKDYKGNTTVLTKSDVPFVWGPVNMNLTYDNTQFVCVDSHKTSHATRETALRLISYYYSNPISRVLGRQWISIIAGTAVLVLLMIVIASVCLWRKGKCTRKDAPTSTASRPDSEASGDYEYVYDEPYELRKRRDKILAMMKKEAEGPKKPAPPPLETMPRKSQNKSIAQIRSAILHEDSLIPFSDLHLLQIDSEGYQIPVPPRLLL